jgi:hypothetical protein
MPIQPEVEVALRAEIVESQRTQAEFLKWKLIGVASLGSLALGFTGADTAAGGTAPAPTVDLRLLMCLVPVVCGYVDAIGIHLMLRILVIGAYLRTVHAFGSLAPVKNYEGFLHDLRSRGNPFLFETFALHGSSLVLAILIGVLGFTLTDTAAVVGYAYVAAGFSGIGLSGALVVLFLKRAARIESMPISMAATAPAARAE